MFYIYFAYLSMFITGQLADTFPSGYSSFSILANYEITQLIEYSVCQVPVRLVVFSLKGLSRPLFVPFVMLFSPCSPVVGVPTVLVSLPKLSSESGICCSAPGTVSLVTIASSGFSTWVLPPAVVLCPGPLVADSSAVSDCDPVPGPPGDKMGPNAIMSPKITATPAMIPIIIQPADPL